jgi:HlyD family secretion protein
MPKIDPTFSAVAAAAVAAIATSVMLNQLTPQLSQNAQQIAGGNAQAADTPLARPVWAASATGRVEPKDGEVRISAEAPARIAEVIAKTNDKVMAGELLVKLDSDDLMPKLAAALSEAEVRVRERDEEPATGVMPSMLPSADVSVRRAHSTKPFGRARPAATRKPWRLHAKNLCKLKRSSRTIAAL